MRLTIIGTSHISPESVQEIKQIIEAQKPDLVAIELDKQRMVSLFGKPSRLGIGLIRHVGVTGFLFALIASVVQRQLGKHIKMQPGDDMRAAVLEAKQHNIPLALIDQPIQRTLKRFSQVFTWRERMRLVGDFFRALFFGKRELKKRGLDNLDLRKVPSKKLIRKLIKELADRYPSLHKVLIEERNLYMAHQLAKISQKDLTKVVVVVGAGHEDGLIELLQKNNVQKNNKERPLQKKK